MHLASSSELGSATTAPPHGLSSWKTIEIIGLLDFCHATVTKIQYFELRQLKNIGMYNVFVKK